MASVLSDGTEALTIESASHDGPRLTTAIAQTLARGGQRPQIRPPDAIEVCFYPTALVKQHPASQGTTPPRLLKTVPRW